MKNTEKPFNEKKIMNKDIPALYEYMRYFNDTLNDTLITICTDQEEIDIIFLQRHIPHLMGLHHFLDKKSKNHLMRYKNQLVRNEGFKNMYNGDITWDDLIRSVNGSIWKDKKMRKRALALHMIREIVMTGDIYKIDNQVKNRIRAKYIIKYISDSTTLYLCIDEEEELDRLDKNYCCISNLIDDNIVKKLVDGLEPMKVKRTIQYDQMKRHIISVKDRTYIMTIRNTDKSSVDYDCLKYLISEDEYISAQYNDNNANYEILYLKMTRSTVFKINRFEKRKKR